MKRELFMCHKHMGLSMRDILEMTVADRKAYIRIHNAEVEKENREMDRLLKSSKH